MMRSFELRLALAGAMMLAACGGDDVGQSISGVVPGDVFAGRSTNVVISGSATDWQEGVTVSFGEGVTVGEIIVASPTALWVPITVPADASLGIRDVTVSQDGEDLTYLGAFSVVSPLQVSSVQGTMAQGSVTTVTVQSVDFMTQFDTTDGNMEVVVPAGMLAVPGVAEPFTFSFTLATDVGATPGPVDLQIISGPPGGETRTLTLPGALEIAAREAEPVSGDITGSFANSGDSKLYSFDPGSFAIVNGVAQGSLVFYVLGEGGSFETDLLAVAAPSFFDPTVAATFLANGATYIIPVSTGAAEESFQIAMTAAVVGDTTADEGAGDNNAIGNAEVIATPLTVSASLSDDTDEDWYEFEITEADAGKVVGVATFANNSTDTVLDVLEADGETSVLVNGETDLGYHESAMTVPLAAGTYFVRVQNTYFDPVTFPPMPGPYNLAVGLTAAE